jgi:beta-galactosidase/beta-glucuronidase
MSYFEAGSGGTERKGVPSDQDGAVDDAIKAVREQYEKLSKDPEFIKFRDQILGKAAQTVAKSKKSSSVPEDTQEFWKEVAAQLIVIAVARHFAKRALKGIKASNYEVTPKNFTRAMSVTTYVAYSLSRSIAAGVRQSGVLHAKGLKSEAAIKSMREAKKNV